MRHDRLSILRTTGPGGALGRVYDPCSLAANNLLSLIDIGSCYLRLYGVLGSTPLLPPFPDSKTSPCELVKNSTFE